MASKIIKGDKVIVIAGNDKGKKGEVTSILTKENKAIVTGINVAKVHKKPTATSAGQILSIEKPINISNLSLIDNDKPAKVGFKIEDNKKIRIFKKSGNKVGK